MHGLHKYRFFPEKGGGGRREYNDTEYFYFRGEHILGDLG